MPNTSVKDLMKSNPEIIASTSTLREAAQKMEEMECGVLPVGSQERIEGVITDRDIVIRAVARGKDTNREKVADYMTQDVQACRADDSAEKAAGMMHENHINRLLVRDEAGNLCGVLTFGHIIRKNQNINEAAAVIECAVGRKVA
jgi:CBS domain-containing protein